MLASLQLTRCIMVDDVGQRTTLGRERLVAVLPMLSERQRQVACLMLEGCSLRRIADKLNLGDSTVRSYMRRIRQVMG